MVWTCEGGFVDMLFGSIVVVLNEVLRSQRRRMKALSGSSDEDVVGSMDVKLAQRNKQELFRAGRFVPK